MRWGEEKTIQFVQLYKQLDSLWNVNHPDYRDRNARTLCLVQLVREMDIPGFTVKDAHKKIRSLRSTYVQELKKITESINSGATQIHTPSLVWFDDMDYIMKTGSSSAVANNSFEQLGNAESELRLEFKEEQPDFYMSEVIEEAVVETSPALEGIENSQTVRVPTLTQRKRRRKLQQPSTTVHELSLLPATPEDECDVIARHIALQLRQLSTSDMLQANVEIQQVLLKYRPQELRAKEDNTDKNLYKIYVKYVSK